MSGSCVEKISKRIRVLCSKRVILDQLNQEIMKVREVIPHTGPIPIVIPLRLFLDDVSARVTWKFRGGGKVQQILYDAILRFQN